MPENNDHDSRTETSDSKSPKVYAAPKLERVGVFRIEKVLSSGGGGTVYLAFDESMKRRVALKVLHPSLSIAPKAQERFAREAWIAGQLEHQNIIKVYSRGEENQLNYIALEFAEGGSLSDFIKQLREETKSKDLTTTSNREQIKSIVTKFIELAEALEYIHSKGFIHRDIKPHNILLAGTDKKFKLTDFGIAHAEGMTRVTKAGDFFGTIHYMSPEQITAHRTTVDKRTDIYSLGVTLYESMTLSLPFEGDSEEKLIGEIISGHYIPARKRLRSIPKDLETILMKATHYDSSRRYQSARDFADDLRRFLDNKPIVARPDSIFYKASKTLSLKRRSNQVAFATILFLAVSGIVLSKMQQNRYDNEKILTTLKRAVESKTSPFEFEPEWPRLSKKLFDHVKEGKLDSTMIWFLKTAAIPAYDYLRYVPASDAHVSTTIEKIQLFSESVVPNDTILISITDMEAIGSYEYLFKNEFYYYYNFRTRTDLKGGFEPLNYAEYKQPSEIVIPVRAITKHFLNSCFIDELSEDIYRPAAERGASSLSVSTINDQVRLGLVNWTDVSTSDRTTFLPTQPVYTDTVLDTIMFWAFDKWPDNFPKPITELISPEAMYNEFKILDYIIAKVQTYGWGLTLKTTIFGVSKPGNIYPPIAGIFKIINLSTGITFLQGELAKRNNIKIRYPSDWNNLNEPSDYIINNDSSFTSTWEQRFDYKPVLDSFQFDVLERLGPIDAKIIIYPSLDIARKSGDVKEYFGDTLTYDIIFQAIDSTGIQKRLAALDSLSKPLRSIRFDSAFLHKDS